MADLLGVNADMIDEIWPIVEPMIQKPLKRTDADKYYTISDIKDLLHEKKMQLWVVVIEKKIVAAIVTTITAYPQINVIEVLFAGGTKMKSWANLAWDTFKQYGKENNCSIIKSGGREGWIRVLNDKTIVNTSWESEIC